MLMTCTDAIPSIQPSWLPGMSNFPSFLPQSDEFQGMGHCRSWLTQATLLMTHRSAASAVCNLLFVLFE